MEYVNYNGMKAKVIERSKDGVWLKLQYNFGKIKWVNKVNVI